MKTINQIEQVRDFLSFNDESDFYFLSLIERIKYGNQQQRCVKNYKIFSHQEFDENIPEICELCDRHNAVAYLQVNKNREKYMFIDLDAEKCENVEEQREKLQTWLLNVLKCQDCTNEQCLALDCTRQTVTPSTYITTFRSNSGYHLVFKPFNCEKYGFSYIFPDNRISIGGNIWVYANLLKK